MMGETIASQSLLMLRECSEEPIDPGAPPGDGRTPRASAGAPKEGEVVDAEFEDLGDKK